MAQFSQHSDLLRSWLAKESSWPASVMHVVFTLGVENERNVIPKGCFFNNILRVSGNGVLFL